MLPNNNVVNERRQSVHNELDNFVTCHSDGNLHPLRLTDIRLSNFWAKLGDYLSVLNEGGSLTLGRGENPASSCLSDILETMFTSPTPNILEGPQLR